MDIQLYINNFMENGYDKERELCRQLGIRLRKARILKDETQENLAARTGVSRQLIGRMERGDASVSLEKWVKVSVVLGLLETWREVLVVPVDPFEEFDRQLHEEEVFRKKRVRPKK